MRQATILVVDDDLETRETLRELLETLGYRIVVAASAEAALALLDGTALDLILSDIHMEGMTGFELCARLKGEPRFQRTPVILLSAISDRDARAAGLSAGADDLLAKPCDLGELRTRVAAFLRPDPPG